MTVTAALNSPTTSAHGTARTAVVEVDPLTLRSWLAARECVLIDVREPDEFARERISGAILHPLSRFDPARIEIDMGQKVVFQCRSGRRSADAAGRALTYLGSSVPIINLTGGIEGWKAAGLPVELNTEAPRMSIMRQTQLTIGLGVLTGLLLGYLVHPVLLLLSALMGCGLVMAGITGACPLATGLSKMPWNKGVSDGNSHGREGRTMAEKSTRSCCSTRTCA